MAALRIFVGHDPRETVAYHVFCHSVLERASVPVSFTPVRGSRRDGSNDFVYSRFLVPWMCDFRGRAVFADGDMLCRWDIAELFDLLPRGYHAAVAKHDYRTKFPVKYLGQKNEDYPRKNWSSLMVLDCDDPAWRYVDPAFVSRASGADLHRFHLVDEDRIAGLPLEWNWLVGEYPFNANAKIAHFTIGTPCWPEFSDWPYADEWRAARDAMLHYEGRRA
jgi:hypothetical protein